MTEIISPASLHRILGIAPSTPLCPADMASALKVAFCRAPDLSPRLERFTAALLDALRSCGSSVSTEPEPGGRYAPGTVVIAPGTFPDHLLPINRVSTLYNNIIVGVFDEPPPVFPGDLPQKTLDAVVGRLAWDMVHLVIYVTEGSWTVCSMNGGVTTFDTPVPDPVDVIGSLVPKLTAQVVPPRAGEIDIRHGALDTSSDRFIALVRDFRESARIWEGNPLLMNHTSREDLAYRNDFYRKIVARYLDERTGMSYGFLARQLPSLPSTAHDTDADAGTGDDSAVEVRIAGKNLLVPIPEVRVVTTRSGCRKTSIDCRHDLVETGLTRGRIWLSTPQGIPEGTSVRPSFDTLTIVAHALGNAMVSSILQALRPGDLFTKRLASGGASMTHWHHYLEEDQVPDGHRVHGCENPPVSCSTPQSAAYSLLGKLGALERAIIDGMEFLGDIHVEPGHGTNLVGTLTLAEAAAQLNGGMAVSVSPA
jgi:hypothetical protein